MSFTWPLALLSLVIGPLLLGLWWLVRRRRRRVTVCVSNLAAIRAAVPARSHWKRRIPVALLVAGLVVLGVGAARPNRSVEVASNATTILLAMDVSRSMCSTDVDPNRITVAQDAAREFVRNQPGGVRIGLVAFAGIAGLIVPPTSSHDKVLKAIDDLQTSRGTAIGMAILASIDAIAEHNPSVAPTGVDLGTVEGEPTTDSSPDPSSLPPPTGPFEADTIIVLTDGANTLGVPPLVAAQQAADRHVRVYTIGFGTTDPAPGVCNIDQVGRDLPGNVPFDVGGGGPGRGRRVLRPPQAAPPRGRALPGNVPFDVGGGGPGRGRRFLDLDEPTLQGVATMTGGQYFRAQDADELDQAFTDLPSEVVTQHEREELTVWFILVGGLLAAAALGLSLVWNRVT